MISSLRQVKVGEGGEGGEISSYISTGNVCTSFLIRCLVRVKTKGGRCRIVAQKEGEGEGDVCVSVCGRVSGLENADK